MSLLEEAKRLIRESGLHPKKRYGQNFLIDRSVMNKMIEFSSLKSDDIVLDIGAGLGFLTEELAKVSKRVIAVEISPQLIQILRERLKGYESIQIIQGDFLKIRVPEFNKVISIPPYSISSPLIFKLFEYEFELGVLIFQKEFAERLIAKPGTKNYGRLTVMVNYHTNVEFLKVVPRRRFYPVPEVDSAIIKLEPREPMLKATDYNLFSNLVRTLFTQRRKKFVKGIRPFLSQLNLKLDLKDSFPNLMEKRVYELTYEDFIEVANLIHAYIGKQN